MHVVAKLHIVSRMSNKVLLKYPLRTSLLAITVCVVNDLFACKQPCVTLMETVTSLCPSMHSADGHPLLHVIEKCRSITLTDTYSSLSFALVNTGAIRALGRETVGVEGFQR